MADPIKSPFFSPDDARPVPVPIKPPVSPEQIARILAVLHELGKNRYILIVPPDNPLSLNPADRDVIIHAENMRPAEILQTLTVLINMLRQGGVV